MSPERSHKKTTKPATAPTNSRDGLQNVQSSTGYGVDRLSRIVDHLLVLCRLDAGDEPGGFELLQNIGNGAGTFEAAVILNLANRGGALIFILILFDEIEDHLLAVTVAHDTFV